MDLTPYIPLMIPAAILVLLLAARVASDLATQATARQATRVAQVEGAVARVAGGIASDLMGAKAAGSSMDVLNDLKGAAVKQGAAYIATAMPQLVASAGATPASLAVMVTGELGQQLVAARYHQPPATPDALSISG